MRDLITSLYNKLILRHSCSPVWDNTFCIRINKGFTVSLKTSLLSSGIVYVYIWENIWRNRFFEMLKKTSKDLKEVKDVGIDEVTKEIWLIGAEDFLVLFDVLEKLKEENSSLEENEQKPIREPMGVRRLYLTPQQAMEAVNSTASAMIESNEVEESPFPKIISSNVGMPDDRIDKRFERTASLPLKCSKCGAQYRTKNIDHVGARSIAPDIGPGRWENLGLATECDKAGHGLKDLRLLTEKEYKEYMEKGN